jgi:homoserine kinase
MALQSPIVDVKFTAAAPGTKKITTEGVHAAEIDTNPASNPAGKALSALTDKFGKPEGYFLQIKTDIPPSKGLGFSGAVAVGAVLCANHLFKLGLKKQALVSVAAKGEPSYHMDNVSASILGGFNIVTRNAIDENEAITTLPPPKDLGLAILVPNVEKSSTEAARRSLPSHVPTKELVRSMGYVAQISAAFAKGDVGMILQALPWDGVIEPARAESGVYGMGVDSGFLAKEKRLLFHKFSVAETISGAGPSRALWYSISKDLSNRRKNKLGTIQPAIALVTERLKTLGHEVQEVFLTKPSSKGATIA